MTAQRQRASGLLRFAHHNSTTVGRGKTMTCSFDRPTFHATSSLGSAGKPTGEGGREREEGCYCAARGSKKLSSVRPSLSAFLPPLSLLRSSDYGNDDDRRVKRARRPWEKKKKRGEEKRR